MYLSVCIAGRSTSAHPRLGSRGSVSIVPLYLLEGLPLYEKGEQIRTKVRNEEAA